ncbi:MAG: methionine synthase [Candidatus Cryptobacteroides sp.]|nr:methionine synthase [Rikenellaceae bacterium]MDY5746782.1 methionine synthase [Candidatus Cryptobacteroides sp.]
MQDILGALGERILILDGAMGTMLQSRGLSGNSEEFNLTAAATVEEIHRAYIEAGADIIETNSFSANRISQSEYGRSEDAAAMALASARIAVSAARSAGRKVWVAGSIGPSGKSLTLAQDLSDPGYRRYSFDDMVLAYGEQMHALIEGGVDLLLLETCFDALNAKAAIYALSKMDRQVPLMISASASDRSGRTLTGQTIEAFYRSVEHASPLSFGLNCSLGAEELSPMVEDVARWAECAVSCHPNAGLPNEMGAYDQSPEQMAEAVGRMAGKGLLNIVGGCCGTTPDHIRAIEEAVRGAAPRRVPELRECLHVSGLEAVSVDKSLNFTNVGERTNVAGSRKFAKLIAAGDYDSALQVAAGQIENGADIIDINMDDAMLDSRAEMEKFLRYISGEPAVARAAIMVDSSHWDTILAGLKNAQGKCIVNSISLKEGEEAFLHKAREIKALGAAVVVMAFDEQGQATDYQRKIDICARAYRLLTEEVGFRRSDIIFDVNVLSVGTGIAEHARYGIDFIEAVRWIKGNLPGALCSGGISNLSFAFRGNNAVREAMHSVFLYHATAAGLDMGIVNPGMLRIYDDIEPGLLRAVEDVILDRDPGATERLIELASAMMEAKAADSGSLASASAAETPSAPVGERIVKALVRGGSTSLEADILECLKEKGRAVDVIEGPLMDGMARVGELFAEGKMFLPQVVKSAKVMRDAVAVLRPYMEQDSSRSSSAKPKILMATVKGDVHDIGKNITGIVMGCNGFEVTDLGVMVPKETILEQAALTGADIIGVSGLITPSLYQMEELCREMSARGLDTPLLIGGATTSALHTAVKLAPLYDHVFYGPDASASAVLAGRLMSDRKGTEAEEHEKQRKLREMYESRDTTRAEAPLKREPFPADSFLKGEFFENIEARSFSIGELLPYFDWQLFYAIWGVKPGTKESEEEMARLNSDAVEAIDRMIKGDACRITLCARFDACHAEGNEIVSADFRLPMLRQAEDKGLSLSDFVAPEAYGFDSPAGMFAISVHTKGGHKEGCDCPAGMVVTSVQDKGGHQAGCDCPACRSEYTPMLERSVRLTLAEAASLWLDEELKRQMKGKDIPACKIIKPAAGYASCPDHSLKRDILRLLPGAEALGIELTASCAMIPDASICGLIFAHPEASYPEIRRLDSEALDAYAARRSFTEAEKALFLNSLKK